METNNANPKKYLEYLCKASIDNSASDLYLSFDEKPTLRISNVLHRLTGSEKLDDKILEQLAEVFLKNEQEKTLFKKHLSIDTSFSIFDRRFRVNISKQSGHFMIVIRLLAEKVPTLDELKMPNILKNLMTKTSGIIFIAGPTGSGKSTTLAAMVEEINNNQSKHIITMEDPIEYIFEPKNSLIEQKQLGKDIVSFSSALKYAMRQRPDVILFGEARDSVGIKNAIALAETGHLVLTTIHARSASQVIQKIISMFPSTEENQITNQLSDILAAIVIQKLVKTKEGGMIAAQEILLHNVALSNIIREHKFSQIKNLIYTNRSIGMQLLENHLLYLYHNGIISLEEAIFQANDPDYIKSEINKNKDLK